MYSRQLKRVTNRLVIRPYNDSDFQLWKKTFSKLPPALDRWSKGPTSPHNLTIQNFRKILFNQEKHQKHDRFYDFVAFSSNQEHIIGHVSLLNIVREEKQVASLGYNIFSNFWGQGLGKEMVSAAIDIAFVDLNLHHLEAGIESDNLRSINLIKSLRFSFQKVRTRRNIYNQESIEIKVFSLSSRPFEYLY